MGVSGFSMDDGFESDLSRGGQLAGRPDPIAPGSGSPVRMSKRSLVLLAEAVKRSFASAVASDLLDDSGRPPGLLIGLFQRRAYFDLERIRYGGLAAAGATVAVGVAEGMVDVPPGVHGLDLSGRSELDRTWALVAVCGSLGAAIVGVDEGRLLPGAPSLEAARTFSVSWTFRRREAVDAARQLLAPLRGRLTPRVLAAAEAALRRTESLPVERAEDALVSALEVIGAALEVPRPARGFFGGPRHAAAERDLLTGVHNRRFLEHYLQTRSKDSAALVLAMLVDLDDLGQMNDKLGEEAGDAALVAVAEALKAESGDGDVVVRYGDDEFLVLAPLQQGASPLAMAERLVMAVRATCLPHPFEDELISVSIGASVADPAHIPYERLADGLQLAKLLGKNAARLVE